MGLRTARSTLTLSLGPLMTNLMRRTDRRQRNSGGQRVVRLAVGRARHQSIFTG